MIIPNNLFSLGVINFFLQKCEGVKGVFKYAANGIMPILLSVASLTLSSCSSELSDDPIPYQPFSDILINLNLPEYSDLNHDGGYMDIDDGGVRGIILYRQNSTTYFAYERNCSYQPNEACATVETHVSGLYMFDPCCSSSFNFSTGQPVGGPAWRPLRKYFVELDGSNLIITDEILE